MRFGHAGHYGAMAIQHNISESHYCKVPISDSALPYPKTDARSQAACCLLVRF